MVIAWKGKDQGLETPLLPVHFTFFKQACGKAAEHQSKWAVLVTGQSQDTKPPQEGTDGLAAPHLDVLADEDEHGHDR